MNEFITLMGAEDVRRAAHEMTRAAQTMANAADSIQFGLQQHQRFLEDWLSQLEQIMTIRPEAKEATS